MATTVQSNPRNAQGSQQQAVTSIRRDGICIVHLYRSENYEGFGFHLQYNKSYFLVRKVEDDSPAADGGLYVDDIILSINQQSTENMPYGTFAKLVDESSRLDLIVQSREEYLYSMIHRPKENRQSIPTIPIPIPIREKAYFSSYTSLKFVDNRTNVNESLYYILSAQESQQEAVTSMRGQGVRSVHLHRSKHDEGFGYSLQYSRNYFLVSHIGHDSPAANSGLCLNDVIIAVNHQSTEDMSYDTLTKLVDKTNDVEFLVQPLEEYLRFQYGPKQDEKSTDDNGKKRFKASVIKVLRKLKQH
ncbi:unnamed protein product [Rotaria sp. Silwood1]|nr:unnamed protein product [Rotaria sp. Silwood1]